MLEYDWWKLETASEICLSSVVEIHKDSSSVPSYPAHLTKYCNLKNLSSGPVTRSQIRNDTGDDTSTLAYEIDKDNYLEHSGINLTQENQEFNCEYLAISAELVKENDINMAFSMQDVVSPTNIDEPLQDPIWKQFMDNKYGALINKKYEMLYYHFLTQIL